MTRSALSCCAALIVASVLCAAVVDARPVARLVDLDAAGCDALVGRTVAQVTWAFGLELASARRTDEPPGKLRVLSFDVHKHRVDLHLLYRADLLFSAERRWPAENVSRSQVQGLRVSLEGGAVVACGEVTSSP